MRLPERYIWHLAAARILRCDCQKTIRKDRFFYTFRTAGESEKSQLSMRRNGSCCKESVSRKWMIGI